MNQLQRAWVWLRRVGHCRGFGVQSPSDYRLVRYVINEHWPYYAYSQLGEGDDWLHRKIGRLLLRLSNWRQPVVIIDQMGYADYLKAGCRKAQVKADPGSEIEMACVPVDCRWEDLLSLCNDTTLIVVGNIWQMPSSWQRICQQPEVRVSFDLYYCGILLFDQNRSKQHYIINF